jgi:sodium transport system permease protein
MKMPQAAWIVFVKELRDALRDRRTLMAVFITSVLMGPLMLVLLSSLVGRYEKRAETREIVVIGLDSAPTLRNYIERQTFTVKAAPADWEAQLKAIRS